MAQNVLEEHVQLGHSKRQDPLVSIDVLRDRGMQVHSSLGVAPRGKDGNERTHAYLHWSGQLVQCQEVGLHRV